MKNSETRRCSTFVFGVLLYLSTQSISLADPSILDRLEMVGEVPQLTPAASKQDRILLRKVASLPAKQIIPPSKNSDFEPSVAVEGTLENYISAVVSYDGKPHDGLTKLGFTSCFGNARHRCVAIEGDPCRKSESESCEGMYLTVFIDITNSFSLDRILGGGYYVVQTVDDIEELRSEAP